MATHEPVCAVTYSDHRESGTNKRARHPMRAATLIVIVLALAILVLSKCRQAKRSK